MAKYDGVVLDTVEGDMLKYIFDRRVSGTNRYRLKILVKNSNEDYNTDVTEEAIESGISIGIFEVKSWDTGKLTDKELNEGC